MRAAARPTAAMVLKMLPRKNLGRRHQRRLRAGLDRGRHGEQRDHGLAAADIALQQAEHAVRAGEIGVDLAERAGLRAGEREGQGGEDALRVSVPSAAMERPAPRRELAPDDGERKLIGEKLVIGEPLPRRRRRREDRRRCSGACSRASAVGEAWPGVLRHA